MKKTAITVALTVMTITAASAATAVYAGISLNLIKRESYSAKETEVKDSDGNIYYVVHTVKTVNGKNYESYDNVPVEFYNETGNDITAVYLTSSDAENRGDNLLGYPENDIILENRTHVSGPVMNYTLNNPMIDIQAETTDGAEISFEHFNLKELKDPTHVNIYFCEDAETGNYYVNFD